MEVGTTSPDGVAPSRMVGVFASVRLLVFSCTIKSRSSLLAPADPGGPRKRAVKWLWCGGGNNSNANSSVYGAANVA